MKIKKLICGLVSIGVLVMPTLAFGQWKNGVGGGFASAQNSNLPKGTIYLIILGIMNWLLILIGIFGVIGFVISGILYLTAAGNEDQMQKGKNAMTWSIIGVIVGLVGYVILQAVDKMLNAQAGF
ncbi:MAG: hypothetical protein ACWGHO_03370 [Candidatus Moraniibacteriota bacterium]